MKGGLPKMGVLRQSSNLRGQAGDGAMFLKGWG